MGSLRGLGTKCPSAKGHGGLGSKPLAAGGLGAKPSGARGSDVGAHSAGRFLQFFYKNNAYFGQNSYFKAKLRQLKAFKINLNVLNRIINEVAYTFCSIRINGTKYDVTFATKTRF